MIRYFFFIGVLFCSAVLLPSCSKTGADDGGGAVVPPVQRDGASLSGRGSGCQNSTTCDKDSIVSAGVGNRQSGGEAGNIVAGHEWEQEIGDAPAHRKEVACRVGKQRMRKADDRRRCGIGPQLSLSCRLTEACGCSNGHDRNNTEVLLQCVTGRLVGCVERVDGD